MKKRLFSLCICLAMLCTLASVSVGAATSDEMVYASEDVRETLYAATQEESFDCFNILELYGWKIVKESITVVYTIDMEELADNGKLVVEPGFDEDTDDGRVYIAKLVDEEGEYVGNLGLKIEDGIAFGHFYDGTPETQAQNGKYRASCSYADHAVRIQDMLKTPDFVSVYDVKYIQVSRVGWFFYIENQDEPVMIPVGYVNVEASNVEPSDNTENWWTVEKLKEQVGIIVEWKREIEAFAEAWKAEHPGEAFSYAIGGPSVITAGGGCGPIDNILNIDEYLGIGTESQYKLPLICGALAVIVLLAIGAGLYYRKCRKAS
ncbi:MAG: hypothetical protein E7651_01530 [Ruminococcaceae bacterium]|nr:hypothetical protein [Oscillospiraceae bacterium]